MSIHVCSDDVSDGSLYDGSYTMTKTLQGYYKLVYIHLDTDPIPWVWSGCNTLHIVNNADLDEESIISFPTSSNSTPANVITWFCDGIATSGWVTATGAYDEITRMYRFDFSTTILIQYDYTASSIAFVFDWFYHNDTFLNPTDHIYIRDRYIDNRPKFLEVYSDQITSETFCSRGDNPGFLISTTDQYIDNQQIFIPSPVSTLDISFYRPGNYFTPVPITNKYDLIFAPSV